MIVHFDFMFVVILVMLLKISSSVTEEDHTYLSLIVEEHES